MERVVTGVNVGAALSAAVVAAAGVVVVAVWATTAAGAGVETVVADVDSRFIAGTGADIAASQVLQLLLVLI